MKVIKVLFPVTYLLYVNKAYPGSISLPRKHQEILSEVSIPTESGLLECYVHKEPEAMPRLREKECADWLLGSVVESEKRTERPLHCVFTPPISA